MKQLQPFLLVLACGLLLVSAHACGNKPQTITLSNSDRDTVGVAVLLPREHAKIIIQMHRGEAKFFRKGDTISVYKPEDGDFQFDNGVPMEQITAQYEFHKAIIISLEGSAD